MEMDNSELLLLSKSLESLAAKVEESVQVLKLSKSKPSGQDPLHPSYLAAEVIADSPLLWRLSLDTSQIPRNMVIVSKFVRLAPRRISRVQAFLEQVVEASSQKKKFL